MKKTNKIVTISISIMILFLLLGCSSCTRAGSPPLGENKVKSYVKENIPENIKLVNKESVPDGTKNTMDIYYYKTIDRDDNIDFEVRSYLYKEYFGYNKRIATNYPNVVRTSYFKRAYKKIEKTNYADLKNIKKDVYDNFDYYNYTKYLTIYISNYDELDDVIDLLYDINDIYSEELQYSSSSFLEKYPLVNVIVKYGENAFDEDESSSIQLGIVKITGVCPDNYIENTLVNKYVELINDETIPYDDSVPSYLYDEVKIEKLTNIYINDTLMTNDMANYKSNSSTKNDYYNNMKENFVFEYIPAKDEYFVSINVGLTDIYANPHVFESVANLVCDSYDVKHNKGKITWEIGKDKYVLKATEDSNGDANSLEVKKNDKKLKINYFTIDYPYDSCVSYLVRIDIDSFAKMFDLDYEIDFDEKAIYFESN